MAQGRPSRPDLASDPDDFQSCLSYDRSGSGRSVLTDGKTRSSLARDSADGERGVDRLGLTVLAQIPRPSWPRAVAIRPADVSFIDRGRRPVLGQIRRS